MKIHGFNLIELLIVMAMTLILATLAYPSYQNCLRDAQRTQAEVELVRLSERMQEYYSQYGTYLGASLAKFGVDNSKQYQFKITELEAQNYLIIAAALNSQTTDACGTLSIAENGARGAARKGCW